MEILFQIITIILGRSISIKKTKKYGITVGISGILKFYLHSIVLSEYMAKLKNNHYIKYTLIFVGDRKNLKNFKYHKSPVVM